MALACGCALCRAVLEGRVRGPLRGDDGPGMRQHGGGTHAWGSPEWEAGGRTGPRRQRKGALLTGLRIQGAVVVDVRVAQAATSHGVTADADGGNGADLCIATHVALDAGITRRGPAWAAPGGCRAHLGEEVIQRSLRSIPVQVAHIQRAVVRRGDGVGRPRGGGRCLDCCRHRCHQSGCWGLAD
jgi:hypothetical protein